MFRVTDEKVFESFGKTCAITVKYDKGPVYYLLSQRGEAMEIHVYAMEREGKKLLREASKLVIEWVKDNYPWCVMLIAPVMIKSVYNLCLKVGFEDYGKFDFKYEDGFAHLMVVKYE